MCIASNLHNALYKRDGNTRLIHSPSVMRTDVSAIETRARCDVCIGNRTRFHPQGRDALCCKQRKLLWLYTRCYISVFVPRPLSPRGGEGRGWRDYHANRTLLIVSNNRDATLIRTRAFPPLEKMINTFVKPVVQFAWISCWSFFIFISFWFPEKLVLFVRITRKSSYNETKERKLTMGKKCNAAAETRGGRYNKLNYRARRRFMFKRSHLKRTELGINNNNRRYFVHAERNVISISLEKKKKEM